MKNKKLFLNLCLAVGVLGLLAAGFVAEFARSQSPTQPPADGMDGPRR